LDARDVWGRTPLHWAAAQGRELLVGAVNLTFYDHENDAWPNRGASGGGGGGMKTTMQRAAAAAAAAAAVPGSATPEEWAELVASLLDRGAAPNLCDVDGYSN